MQHVHALWQSVPGIEIVLGIFCCEFLPALKSGASCFSHQLFWHLDRLFFNDHTLRLSKLTSTLLRSSEVSATGPVFPETKVLLDWTVSLMVDKWLSNGIQLGRWTALELLYCIWQPKV
jgi:hypothetical protein